MKRLTRARRNKDWFERAKLVVAAARDRAVETAQQRRAPSTKRFLPCCRGAAWLRGWRTMGPSFRRLRTKQTCPTRLSDCSWHFVARASLIIARSPWKACPVQQDDGDSAERVRHGRAGTAVFSVTSERALGPFGKRLRRYVPRRIVRRRHLCASAKCRMNARH